MATETEAPGQPGLIDRVLSSVDAVLRKVTATKQAAAQAAEQRLLTMREEYLAILCRADSPKAGDALRLEQLVIELVLDSTAVKADANRVVRLRADIDKAAQSDELNESSSAAFEELRATQARHAVELKEAEHEAHRARTLASRGQAARQAVNAAWRQNSELFGPGRLEFPANLPKPGTPEPPKPVRKCALVEIHMGNNTIGYHPVEPVVGPDGEYVQNANGKYLLPSGEYSP